MCWILEIHGQVQCKVRLGLASTQIYNIWVRTEVFLLHDIKLNSSRPSLQSGVGLLRELLIYFLTGSVFVSTERDYPRSIGVQSRGL